MSNLRDQLLKAGLVNASQVKRAKHEERVHRTEAGREGLEREAAERDAERRSDVDAERAANRAREESRRVRDAEVARERLLVQRLAGGRLREGTAGARRWYFVAEGGRVTYLDLSDDATRRVQRGLAAIVVTRGHVRGEFCLVDATTAGYLSQETPDLVCFWNRGASA